MKVSPSKFRHCQCGGISRWADPEDLSPLVGFSSLEGRLLESPGLACPSTFCSIRTQQEINACSLSMTQSQAVCHSSTIRPRHFLTPSFVYMSRWFRMVLLHSFCSWQNGGSRSYIICMKSHRQQDFKTGLTDSEIQESNNSPVVIVALCNQMENGRPGTLLIGKRANMLCPDASSAHACLDSFILVMCWRNCVTH